MNMKTKLAGLFLGALLATTSAFAANSSCGTGKCGGEMKKEVKEKTGGSCGTGKCGAEMKKEGTEKATSSDNNEMKKEMKEKTGGSCGAGKCGASK